MAKYYVDIEKRVVVRVCVENVECYDDAVTAARERVDNEGVDEFEVIDEELDEYDGYGSNDGIYDKESDHDDLVEYIKENCDMKKYFVAWGWDCIGNKDILPNQVEDAIDNTIDEWADEHDIDKETIDRVEDIEDLFMECFESEHDE